MKPITNVPIGRRWGLVLRTTGLIFLVLNSFHARAQAFRILYSFTPLNGGDVYAGTNSDGASPTGLILSSNTLCGTTRFGGSGTSGTVFALDTEGASFTTLYNFTPRSLFPCPCLNADGYAPLGLMLSSNLLYGTAAGGGNGGVGTVFLLNTDGTGFSALYSFTASSDGGGPNAPLVLSTNSLYGTASGGGNSGNGTVFTVNSDGTGFISLYSFTPTPVNPMTNTDGANPRAGLTISGNTIYGTTFYGGTAGNGTLFAINTDGTDFRTLHVFSALSNITNSDGAYPKAGLLLSGNTLYGTANEGGSSGWGTVFKVNTDGTGFSTLHNFPGASGPPWTNVDGGNPQGGLQLSGNTLYGAAGVGGIAGAGTVFALNTDGTGFVALHSFKAVTGHTTGNWAINEDGAFPTDLVLAGDTLYGITSEGGPSGYGTIFGISLPIALPQLNISSAGTNILLTWPTNATGFTLQSTTNLGPAAIWTTNLSAPAVVNGQNAVTNPISGTQQFFRLSQ